MAINQVSVVGPRSEAREPVEKKKDWQERLMEGLQIAQGITGIASNVTTIQKNNIDKANMSDAREGINSSADMSKLITGGAEIVEPGTKGSMEYRYREGDSVMTKHVRNATKAPAPLGGTYKEVAGPNGKPIMKWLPNGGPDQPAYVKPEKGAGGSFGPGLSRKLNAEERKRLDSASMGISAVQDMRDAYAAGDNTFSLMGDNDYTAARTRFEEAIGRMQSGGAINDDEASRFKKMVPTATDGADMQEKKLDEMYREMSLRVTSLGADPAKLMAERKAVVVPPLGGGSPGTAQAAPARKGDPKTLTPPEPKIGEVRKGHRYKGGNPADQSSWEPVK